MGGRKRTAHNEVMHRMSGTHICSRFEWPWMPLIGDLGRSAYNYGADGGYEHSRWRQSVNTQMLMTGPVFFGLTGTLAA
jgi:hypothetical protein